MGQSGSLVGEGTVSGTLLFIPLESSLSSIVSIECQEDTSNALSAIQSTEVNIYSVFGVGDVRPISNDLNGDGDACDAGEFGDGIIDAPDVVNSLKLITGLLEGPCPESDLFDAFDMVPEDFDANQDGDFYDEGERGGNSIIDVADVQYLSLIHI